MGPFFGKRAIKRISLFALGGAGTGALCIFYANKRLYRPVAIDEHTEAQIIKRLDLHNKLQIHNIPVPDTKGHHVRCYVLPSPVANAPQGSEGRLEWGLGAAKKWQSSFPCTLIIPSYRGFARSSPILAPTPDSIEADVSAVYAKFPCETVFGHSLGGAVACRLACKQPIENLIIENTFVSLAHLLGLPPIFSTSLLRRHDWDSASLIPDLQAKRILLLSGGKDDIVPSCNLDTLYRKLRERGGFLEVKLVHFENGKHSCHQEPFYHSSIARFIQNAVPNSL